MDKYVGKWEITYSEKYLEYMAAIGVEEQKRNMANKVLGVGSNMTYDFSVSGEQCSFRIWTSMGETETKFRLGQEFDNKRLDGEPMTDKFYMEGDKLMEVQRGHTFESIIERTVKGNEMTMLMTAGGVTCTRKFKRI